MRRSTTLVAAATAAVLALSGTTTAGASDAKDQRHRSRPGFHTSQPAMLTPVRAGVTVRPLLTVGDRAIRGYRFEAVPDGISVRRGRHGRVNVYVNHETSKIPFPYSAGSPSADTGESDFDNAQLSHLVLNRHGAGVLRGEMVIKSKKGFQRFCSNYLATRREGFRRPTLFTNEESPDYVYRKEDSWPPVPGSRREQEAGVVVAMDVRSGRHKAIYGMGRHNHENAVPVPGYGKPVVLSGDDTYTSGPLTGVFPEGAVPAQSQLYSYIAKSSTSLMKDNGNLWAFVSDTPGVKNYYDVAPGSGTNVKGHFIKVPKRIATGQNRDGTTVKAADLGYPAPPDDGSWQTDLRKQEATGIDGPQWVLEYWSDIHDVFQFVRVEDIAYDKRRGKHNIVYLADSGRGRRPGSTEDTAFPSTNGRVWRMVLDKRNPRKVKSLRVLVEGDDSPVKTLDEVHQPDNLESTRAGLMVTEDPGSSQQFPAGSDDPNATTARLWFVPFSGTPHVLAKVDQSSDGGSTDVDGRPNAGWGAWESTGVVDASKAFGPGAFLINVQAHSLWVDTAPGEDNNGDGEPDFTYKREGGQLALLRVPTR